MVRAVDFAVTATGQHRLCSASDDGTMKLWALPLGLEAAWDGDEAAATRCLPYHA